MKKKKTLPLSIIKLLNTFFVTVPFMLCWFFYYEPFTRTYPSTRVAILVFAVYSMIFYSLSSQNRTGCFSLSPPVSS